MFRILPLVIFFPFISEAAVSLNQSYLEAFQKNELVPQSQNRLDQDQYRYDQLRGGILPNLSLNGTYFYQPKLEDPLAQDFYPNEQTTVNLSVTQPLFRGLREFSAMSQQKLLFQADEDNQRRTLLQLYQNVAQSYFAILSYEQELKNLNQKLEAYQKRFVDIQRRVDRGESSASDALTAQTAEINTQSEIQLAQNNLASERENFNFLTGLSPDTAVMDPQLLKSGKKFSLDQLETFLSGMLDRPDVMEAQKRLDAIDKDVTIAKGAHLPTLDFTGNYYFLRPNGFLKEIDWDIQLKLTFPLFEGGATQAKVNEAVSKRKDAELQLARTKRQAEQEIRSLYQGLRIKLEQLQTLQRALDVAEKNTNLLTREYRSGLWKNIDVQVALADYWVTKRLVDQVHFSAQYDWIRLQAASSQLNPSSIRE